MGSIGNSLGAKPLKWVYRIGDFTVSGMLLLRCPLTWVYTVEQKIFTAWNSRIWDTGNSCGGNIHVQEIFRNSREFPARENLLFYSNRIIIKKCEKWQANGEYQLALVFVCLCYGILIIFVHTQMTFQSNKSSAGIIYLKYHHFVKY